MRWTEVARQTNRIPHRQMQWPGIRGDAPGSGSKPEPDASWLEPPEEGSLPAALSRPLWQHLERHTQAPERCYFGLWDGFGCLGEEAQAVPSFATRQRRWHLFYAPISAAEGTFCASSGSPMYLISEGIAATLDEFGAPAAPDDDTFNVTADDAPLPHQSANLWWPEDHAWCVATEIDFMTTYIGGTRDTIDAIVKDKVFEAYRVEPTDGITYASDTLNPSSNI